MVHTVTYELAVLLDYVWSILLHYEHVRLNYVLGFCMKVSIARASVIRISFPKTDTGIYQVMPSLLVKFTCSCIA